MSISFRPNYPLLFCLCVIIAMGIGWWRDRQKYQILKDKLELPALPFSAEQAVGPPIDLGSDYEHCWFPSRKDSQNEWLILDYEQEFEVATILIYEAYSMGRVTKVSTFLSSGEEFEIWSGKAPKPQPNSGDERRVIFRVEPTYERLRTKYLKLYFDDAKPLGCFAIDAVGIQDSAGVTHWASGASASSSYGQANRPLYRTTSFSFMQPKWHPDGHMDTDF